jgi:hypothetical protein
MLDPIRRIPSVKQLAEIHDAALAVIRGAERMALPGEVNRSGVAMVIAIGRLEGALNPRRVAFSDLSKKAWCVSGWPDALGVMGALQCLRELQNEILRRWKLEAFCEHSDKPSMIYTADGKGGPDGCVRIKVGKRWPPKIGRDVIEGMRYAVSQLGEAVDEALVQVAGRKPPNDLITTAVAVYDYRVSRATLQRAISLGKIKTYRNKGAAKNAPHLFSRADIAALWRKR